ncbi:MAG: hypothetical protein ALECFALPRED_005758 [Alectoria fallacina]|uniref:Uncharacterized protein n=1 Tax=Alectoria fallacina TaxID=1903189 RepID=A0A8H3G624_9LECA|nr:MAG: hypothetical protein ALECFALPRED_005758 [Alectoria fallacina]
MPDEAVKEQFESSSAKEAKPESDEFGVGGTAQDGGVSTAGTVADGGPDDEDEEADGEFKP